MTKFIKIVKYFLEKGKLLLIFITRIIFAKRNFKAPYLKTLYYNFTRGFISDQLVIYNINKKNEDQYLSEFDWYRSRKINDPYNNMVNNKVICNEMLKQYVKVPNTLVIKTRKRLTSFNNEFKTYDDVIKMIKKEKKVFIKPIAAGKGKGVCLIEYKNSTFYVDDVLKGEEELKKYLVKNDGWFLSETIKQSDYLNSLYDKTTNTIRFITMKDPKTGDFKLFFAVQRIGTKKTIPVDNGSRGGLVSKIDIETGELSVAKSLHTLESYTNHPDSNSPIEGVKIPNWPKIKDEMLSLANKFPFLTFIAWDILITDEKEVCIIEANTSSGVNIIQIWGGQRQGELGEFYRHHKIIK